MLTQLLIGFVVASIIAPVSYRFGFLTRGGSWAQFVLGVVLLGIGGWKWTIPMLVFFLSSSLLSNLGRVKKEKVEALYAKSTRRDASQVAANGLTAGVIVLLNTLFPSPVWFTAYLGAVAAVTADTWGTEIGTLFSISPRLITTWETVERGRSGAISPFGTLAGMAGALVIWSSAVPWFQSGAVSVNLPAVLVGGILGTLADSFLGATVQAQYECPSCGAITERLIHCSTATLKAHGLHVVTNDVVNGVCSVVGSIAAVLLCRC